MNDIAFTESVKAVQSRRGSRAAYAKLEAKGGFPTKITSDLHCCPAINRIESIGYGLAGQDSVGLHH